MTLQAGAKIWIPCEVKPGPFSDERFVRVRDNGFDWLGFVQVKQLREPILEGSTFIDAMVVSVNDRSFKARPTRIVRGPNETSTLSMLL